MSHLEIIPILTGVNSPIMEEGCPYCFQYFYLADIKIHLTQCTLNPANAPDVSASETFSNLTHKTVTNKYTSAPHEYDEYSGEEDQEFSIQDYSPLEDRASDNAPPLTLNFCAFDECIDPTFPPSPPINRFCLALDLDAPDKATQSQELLPFPNDEGIPNIDFTQPQHNSLDPRRKKTISLAVPIPNQSLVTSSHDSQLIQSDEEICPISIDIERPKNEEYADNNSCSITETISETKSEFRKVCKLSKVKPNIKSENSVGSHNKYARKSSRECNDSFSSSTGSSYDSSDTSYSRSHRRENRRYYSRTRSYRRSYSRSSSSSSSCSSSCSGSNGRSSYEHDSKDSSVIKPPITPKGKAKSKPSDREKWLHDKYNSRSRSRSNDRWPHDKYDSMPWERSRSSSYRRIWPHREYRSYSKSRSYSRSYDSSFSSPDRSTHSRRRSTVKSSKETVYHSEHYSYRESGKASSYSSTKRKRQPSLERPTSSKYSKYDSSVLSTEYSNSSATFQNPYTSNFNRLNLDSLHSAYPTYSQFIHPTFPSASNSLCYSNPIIQQTPNHLQNNSQFSNQKPYVPQNIAPPTSQKPELINAKIEKEPKSKAVPNMVTNTLKYPVPKVYDFFVLGDDTSYLEFPIPTKRDNKTEFICKLCSRYSTSNVYSKHLLEHIKVICIFCREVMSTTLLLSHLYTKHSSALNTFTGCPVCNYRHKNILSSVPKFFRHILVAHYRLTCPVCFCGVGLFTFENHVDRCVKKLAT